MRRTHAPAGANINHMNQHCITVMAVFGSFLILPAVRCADAPEATGPPAAPSGLTVTLVASADTTVPETRVQRADTPDRFDVASVEWGDIKDVTFARRAEFFSGANLLEARAEMQILELNAKRTAMAGGAETKDWDFEMKTMKDARSYLKSMVEESRLSTSETWAAKREKVGLAWARTQDAYSRVRLSTTR